MKSKGAARAGRSSEKAITACQCTCNGACRACEVLDWEVPQSFRAFRVTSPQTKTYADDQNVCPHGCVGELRKHCPQCQAAGASDSSTLGTSIASIPPSALAQDSMAPGSRAAEIAVASSAAGWDGDDWRAMPMNQFECGWDPTAGAYFSHTLPDCAPQSYDVAQYGGYYNDNWGQQGQVDTVASVEECLASYWEHDKGSLLNGWNVRAPTTDDLCFHGTRSQDSTNSGHDSASISSAPCPSESGEECNVAEVRKESRPLQTIKISPAHQWLEQGELDRQAKGNGGPGAMSGNDLVRIASQEPNKENNPKTRVRLICEKLVKAWAECKDASGLEAEYSSIEDSQKLYADMMLHAYVAGQSKTSGYEWVAKARSTLELRLRSS